MENILENEIGLKCLQELTKFNFFIPGYQRGYRWTRRQVRDLLNDIREFQEKDPKKEEFYCLQPVVVRSNGDQYELIDGQQRLTTIHIILSFLKPVMTMLGEEQYNLSYETREGSCGFLLNIEDNLASKELNIDYYHICSAYETVKEWFNEQEGAYKLTFLQTLLNSDTQGKNVKVIWYEIHETSDPVDIFTRLNSGKIPLTNAELIKGLFLNKNNFTESHSQLKQFTLAQEWDGMEKALQSDDFWYFIHNDTGAYPNRIEYILSLLAEQKSKRHELDIDRKDPLYSFIVFNHLLKSGVVDAERLWGEVKTFFMTFEEWFRDRYLYHLIGFLINENKAVGELIELATDSESKTIFRNSLKKNIYLTLVKKVPKSSVDLHEIKEELSECIKQLDYDKNRQQIKSALLLFNIVTLVENKASTLRFQFDSYKTDTWDIEHIRSVKSEKPERPEEQKKWLMNVWKYMVGSDDLTEEPQVEDHKIQELLQELKVILTAVKFDMHKFEVLYEKILIHFKESDEQDTDNSVGNLTLLDSHTNRSYKNAVFPIKRERIMSLDKAGTFVPLCTKNVFLKYYSSQIDNMMFWSPKDSTDHIDAMITTLDDFFTPKGDN